MTHKLGVSGSNTHKVERIIRFLSQSRDVTFVFEHTPETNPSRAFVNEGYSG